MEASRWQKRRLLRQQYRQHEGPTKKKGKQAVQNQTQEHLQPGDTGKRSFRESEVRHLKYNLRVDRIILFDFSKSFKTPGNLHCC